MTVIVVLAPSAPVVAASAPSRTIAMVAALTARTACPRRVNFPVGVNAEVVADVIEFDPSLETGRLDVDVQKWAHFTGMWRKSDLPPPGKNLWKMDPLRDSAMLSYHILGLSDPA